MIAEKINIGGIAIKPGVSKNGINYTKEALIEFASTMANRPILKDHKGETDNTIGVIESSQSDAQGIVTYAGWIKEDGSGIIEKINDGRIREVSIGAFASKLVKENDDDEYLTVVGLEAMELSTTPVPAVKGTSLVKTLDLMKQSKTDESVKIIPVVENSNVFEAIPEQNIINKKTEVSEMADEEVKKEPEAPAKEETKEEPKVEAPAVEPEAKAEAPAVEEESAKPIKLNVETTKLDEAIAKVEKLVSLKEKLKENVVEPIKEDVEPVDKTHGKVAKTEEKIEDEEKTAEGLVVESSELGTGFSIWSQPKADGRLN